MEGFEFAVVGAGWRTDFFLRVAAALPQMKLCGVVARNETRAQEVESDWGVACFASISDLTRIRAGSQPTPSKRRIKLIAW